MDVVQDIDGVIYVDLTDWPYTKAMLYYEEGGEAIREIAFDAPNE